MVMKPLRLPVVLPTNKLTVNPYGLHLGNRLPAHATSAGKILLAHLSQEEQLDWLQNIHSSV